MPRRRRDGGDRRGVTSPLRPWVSPAGRAAWLQPREGAPARARSHGQRAVRSDVSDQRKEAGRPAAHHRAPYPCQLQGTRSDSQSIPPHSRARPSRALRRTRMTGRWQRRRQQKTRPPAPSAHRRQPQTSWTGPQRSVSMETPGGHVTRLSAQLPLPSVRLPAVCPPSRPAPSRPRPFAPPRPCPAERPRLRPASSALPPPRARPGGEQGRRGRPELGENLGRKERGQRAGPEPPEPGLPATPQSGRGK